VSSILGTGAAGQLVTDSLGTVVSVNITSGGNSYLVVPHTTIKTSNTTGPVATLNIQSQNYLTQITVANSSFVNSTTAVVGNGYAFSVTGGVIYQKGSFLKVDPQVIIVSKYSGEPDGLSVGFDTVESIVQSTADTSLLDNATGTPNYTAPGADRMKLTPTLQVLSTEEAAANLAFLPLVEFSEGRPYKENRVTVYNTLAREFERRTRESAGDYVLDPFSVTTREKIDTNNQTNTTHFSILIDPGTAYVSGTRIETLANKVVDVAKATDTKLLTSQAMTTNYGQYVLVNEIMGSFDLRAGSSIDLYDTPAFSISNTSVTSVSAPAGGTVIGTAKFRSLKYNNGVVGTSTAQYELYLFDIQMSAGYNFRQVRSIHYNGSGIDGIADCVRVVDPSLAQHVTQLKQTNSKAIVFDTGLRALKDVNTTSFVYKTTNESLSANSVGCITVTLSDSEETFPYTPSSSLTDTNKEDIIIVPTANLQASANLAGSIVVTNNYIVGTSTAFVTALNVGDYIKAANTTASQVFQIISIANNTYATVTANATTMNAITANAVLFFPQYKPLQFVGRDDRPITLNASGKTLTANLNISLTGSGGNVAASYSVRKTSSGGQITRSVYRDVYVKLQLSNNASTNTGPWCLGVPDAFRLKNVYLHSDATVNVNSQDVTKYFFIDSGQNDDYYGLSYLRRKAPSSPALQTSDYLLVRFDAFKRASQGFSSIKSFAIDDANTLAGSVSTINTIELPEYYNRSEKVYLLRDCIDFRPAVSNTAAVTNVVASATLNPSNTNSFDTTTKYFPEPDTTFTYNAEQYLGRRVRVILNKNGEFIALNGAPATQNFETPPTPADSMSLAIISVPPYPTLGEVSIGSLASFKVRNIGNASGPKAALSQRYSLRTDASSAKTSQPQGYTMRDLVSLEDRIKALESQVLFNTLENDINKINIPSELDKTVNRFKNGFFVDSFTDTRKADGTNKEYAASIDFERGELHPLELHINMQMQFNRSISTTNNAIVSNTTLMLPYQEFTLVSQPFATSYVKGDGVRGQFIGECTMTPAAFPVEAVIEQTLNLTVDGGVQTVIRYVSGGGGG
jgi:hypothetical protein